MTPLSPSAPAPSFGRRADRIGRAAASAPVTASESIAKGLDRGSDPQRRAGRSGRWWSGARWGWSPPHGSRCGNRAARRRRRSYSRAGSAQAAASGGSRTAPPPAQCRRRGRARRRYQPPRPHRLPRPAPPAPPARRTGATDRRPATETGSRRRSDHAVSLTAFASVPIVPRMSWRDSWRSGSRSRSSRNLRRHARTRLKSKRSSRRATSSPRRDAWSCPSLLPESLRAGPNAPNDRATGPRRAGRRLSGGGRGSPRPTALASPNDPGIVKYRQILEDALTMARAQIGELTIQGNPPGAEVVVNGRVVGALPLPSPVKLPARNTEIVVRAPGHSDSREMVPIAGGQRHALTVNLEKDKASGAAPALVRRRRRPLRRPPSCPRRRRRRR